MKRPFTGLFRPDHLQRPFLIRPFKRKREIKKHKADRRRQSLTAKDNKSQPGGWETIFSKNRKMQQWKLDA